MKEVSTAPSKTSSQVTYAPLNDRELTSATKWLQAQPENGKCSVLMAKRLVATIEADRTVSAGCSLVAAGL